MTTEHSEFPLTDDPDTNPFVAPSTGPQTSIVSLAEQQSRWLRWAWPTAIALHLPIPTWYGFQVTSADLARFGMLLGVVAVYWFGRRLCVRWPNMMRRLAVGSMITSVSQFWPVGQMWIGYCALTISEMIDISPLTTPGNIGRVPMIFLATVLTGLGLIIPSLIIGIIAAQVFKEVRATSGTATE